MSFSLKLVMVLGVLGALGFGAWQLIAAHDRKNDAEEARNHSEPAWCATKALNGLDLCWLNFKSCEKHKVECEQAFAYSCFEYTQVTDQRTNQICLKTYGECIPLRERAKADPEATDVTDCLVYRSQDIGGRQ